MLEQGGRQTAVAVGGAQFLTDGASADLREIELTAPRADLLIELIGKRYGTAITKKLGDMLPLARDLSCPRVLLLLRNHRLVSVSTLSTSVRTYLKCRMRKSHDFWAKEYFR